MNRKIAIITEGESDILKVIQKNNIPLYVFKPGEIDIETFDNFDAVAILGGVSENPILLHPRERIMVEEQLKKGKKVFAEYCASIGNLYFEPPARTRYERLVFCPSDAGIDGIEPGDLLDDQCGMRIRPYPNFCSHNTPLLQFIIHQSHSRLQDIASADIKIEDRALWFDNPENLLISSFRLANFIRARFAPKTKFKKVIKYILGWLLDTEINMDVIGDYYHTGVEADGNSREEKVRASVEKAMGWFESAEIVLNDGNDGALEGLGTEIYPDGKQRVRSIIRTDCVGEISLAYFMYSLLNNDEKSRRISDNLAAVCFDLMQCKEQNEFHGMIRWTQEAWGVCYQDDVARTVIPQLLKCFYTGSTKYLKECSDALAFLVRTTGTDGTRVFRTDNIKLNSESIRKLASTPGKLLSAHYNGYYFAALLLAYKLTGNDEFKRTAVKGMETIMSVYPDTVREQSQTEECCRLILPLSWLYWVTGEERHKSWLYSVVGDLQRFKHPSGCYLEWDEGYKASMRNKAGEGECSLLSYNGDPVADMLYSNNWLPVGLIQAYFVTGDPYFKTLWEQTAEFMINAQLQSRDEKINGAWARGFDVEYMEVFGSPADAGWGPWAIESGWTVAEIVSGLIMGLIDSVLTKHYKI